MKNVAVIINTNIFTHDFCGSMEIIIDHVFNYPQWHNTSSGERICYLCIGDEEMKILQALNDADCIEIRK